MNAAAARGGQAVNRPKAGGWRVAEPEAGDPVFICPDCWPAVAAFWQAQAGATVRLVGAAAGVGALRDLRSGAGVLMRAVEEGGAVTVRKGSAPGDGGACWNGESKAT